MRSRRSPKRRNHSLVPVVVASCLVVNACTVLECTPFPGAGNVGAWDFAGMGRNGWFVGSNVAETYTREGGEMAVDLEELSEVEKLPEVAIRAMDSLFDLWQCLEDGLTIGDLEQVVRLAVPPGSADAIMINMAIVNVGIKRAITQAAEQPAPPIQNQPQHNG